jgi:uncharacterized protein (TIGR02186 family)
LSRRAVASAAALSILLVLAAGLRALAAEVVVASLSHHNVSLTTGFAGSELFVYGAVRRTDARPEPAEKLDIIIAITGPMAPVIVRKKERHYGIWTNGEPVEVDAAPSFYVVASSGELRDVITWTDDLRYRIGLEHVIKLIDAPDWVEDREEYRVAVARVRERQGLYSVLPGAVRILENTLFETRIDLPADLIEGDYTARVFLVRDKQVLDVFSDTIEVRRAPLGRFIYVAAQEHAPLYGAASLALALAAGWLASAFFRTFFPS